MYVNANSIIIHFRIQNQLNIEKSLWNNIKISTSDFFNEIEGNILLFYSKLLTIPKIYFFNNNKSRLDILPS